MANPERFEERDGIFVSRHAVAARGSWALRLMLLPILARIYEDLWRPIAISLVSHLNYRTEDAIVDKHLTSGPGLRVLELCCGTARAGRRWVDMGAEVLGIDLSMPMLVQGRRRCHEGRMVLVCADAVDRIARPASFDAALCFAALHLLEDPNLVISVAATALRPGGLYFAWVLTSTGRLRTSAAHRLAHAIGVRLFDPRALAICMADHKLTIIDQFSDGAIELVVARRDA